MLASQQWQWVLEEDLVEGRGAEKNRALNIHMEGCAYV